MAELYIVDGLSDPIDISYFTEEEKKEFFELRPNAKKVNEEQKEQEVVKTNDSANVVPSVGSTNNMESSLEDTSLESPVMGPVAPSKKQQANTIESISKQLNVREYDEFVLPTAKEKEILKEEVKEISLEPYKQFVSSPASPTTGISSGNGSMQQVQPYEDEMKLAKSFLTKNKMSLTPENIDQYTRNEIYKAKVNDIEIERNDEFFDNMDTDDFINLKSESAYKSKMLKKSGKKTSKTLQDELFKDLDTRKKLQEYEQPIAQERLTKALDFYANENTAINRNIASFTEAMVNPGDRFNDIPEDELIQLQNGNKVPKIVFEKYSSLIQAKGLEKNYLLKQVEELNNLDKDVAQSYKSLDFVSRNWDLMDQALAVAANSVSDASASLASATIDVSEILLDANSSPRKRKTDKYKQTAAYFKEQKDGINFYRNKSNEDLQKNYAYKPKFGDQINPFNGSAIKSLVNLGEFAVLGLAGQTGTLLQLSMGSPGLAVLGASTYGRTISDIEIADEQAGSITGNLEKRLTALGFAVTEVGLGAYPTQKLISNAFTAVNKGGKQEMISGIRTYLQANWDNIPMSFATEYVTEGATQLVQNTIDITRGAKDMSQLMEGVGEAAFTGGLLGPMITSIPFVKGMVYSHYSSWNEFAPYRERAEQIAILNKEVENLEGPGFESNISSNLRIKMIADLTAEQDAFLTEKGKSILSAISPEGDRLYRSALLKQQNIRQEAIELMNQEMDPNVKASRLKKLKAEFDYLEIARNSWLQDFQQTFSVEENSVREEYLNKAATELNLKRGADSGTKIEDRANDLYEIDKIKTANDNAINLIVTLGQGNVDVNYEYSDDNSVLLTNYKAKLQELVDLGVFSQEIVDRSYKSTSEKLNAGTINGANIRYKDLNGKYQNLIFVSEVNSLKNRRSQTPVHEITHTILAEALKNNPQDFQPLANGIMTYLAENNSAAFFRIRENTQGQSPEEVLNVFIEEVTSGRLDLEKSSDSVNWTSIFGFELSKAMGTENAFEGVTDIVEFLTTLGNKINDGTFSLKDLETIQEVGLPKPKEDAKNPDDIIKEKTKAKSKAKVVGEDKDIVVKKSEQADIDKVSDLDLLQKINNLVPSSVKTQQDFFNPKVFNKIFNDGKLDPLIQKYIRSKSSSGEQGSLNIKNVADRLMNFNPAKERASGKAVGAGAFAEFITSNTNFGKRDSNKELFKTQEKNRREQSIDDKTSQIAGKPLSESITEKRIVSKLGRGITLRGKKLITIENSDGFTLKEQIEIAALETFKGTMPSVDSKKYKDFVLNQENVIRKAIQSRVKNTSDFKQVLKEFLPLYKSYPLPSLVQMERLMEDKVLIKEIRRLTKPKEVDKAIAENKLPKNTNRTSGPILYDYANPTLAQLQNFFFGDNVKPSTKGTRKDAFFRGLATQLISDMAPEAARKAGLDPLEITKMSSRLNVDPSIKFSESRDLTDVPLTEDQLNIYRELSKDKDKDDIGVRFGFDTKTINEETRPGLVKNLIKHAKEFSDVTINGAAMQSGGKQGYYKYTKNGETKYRVTKPAKVLDNKGNQINKPIKYVKTTDGKYFKITEIANLKVNWVPKIGKLFWGAKDQNLIKVLELGKKYKGKKPVKIDLKKLKKYNKEGKLDAKFIKDNKPQIDANMDALEYMINELSNAYKNGVPMEVIGMLVIQSYQATGGLIKIAAPFRYVNINKFEIGDKKDVSKLLYREEHNPPASVLGASIIYAVESNTTKQLMKAIIKNYYQTQLSKKDDSKIDRAKLDSTLYEGTSIFDDPITRLAAAGIDLNTLINPLTGETMAQEYDAGIPNDLYNSFSETGKAILSAYQNMEILKSVTDSNVKMSENIKTYAKLVPDMVLTVNYSQNTFGSKLDGTKTTAEQIEILGKYDKAAALARSFSTPTKKIRVFDFDDTLAKTNSKVIVNTLDGKTTKINATQFARQGQALEADGATFDFTEFEKVIDGKKGPLFDLAKTMSEADGKRDIFILTARPQASATAIKEFLDGVGLNIPLANITGLENGSPEAKANWVIDKASNGYNDFYFADDAIKNVKAVKEILSQIDVKSEVQLAKFSEQANMDKVFNDMIERTTGIESFKEFSDSKARRIGKNKGKYSFFIPPSAEDFAGLMYPLYGKGKQGDRDMRWINENVIGPFGRAENALTQARLSVANDYRALKKNFKTVPKTLKKEAFDGFTYSDALRVSIWTSQGMDVPGLSKSDIKQLNEFIESNAELRVFAEELVKIQKGKPYPEPTKSWLGGTITTDILGNINKVNRAEYLQQWQQNVDVLFSDKNKNKLRAAFGDNYVEALEDSLRRMKSGSNRARSDSRIVNNVTDWINNSVGAIMFFNARSAVLQTISAVNFINWSDNNILNAGLAFANQPQFWKDFMYLMNSDFLKARRNGLKINVSESEIADAVAESTNKPKAAIAYLLSKGFLPTQFADSFAIASGGATFYRNRIKKYIKEGMPQELAEQKAFLDFYDLAEETQQSSRTDRISQQQASTAGRVILAFANTPMQYARLQKKALLDLKNGRGDAKTHVSKIIYYGFLQNLLFNALQNALFAMAFDDDDEDEAAKKAKAKSVRIANGMTDSLLRGLGIGGVAVATIKNIAVKLYDESEKRSPKYEDAALELLSFSPPIDSKVTKFRSALRTMSWNSEEIKEKGFSLDNPAYLAGGQVVSAFTNIPLDRVVRKYDNLSAAFKKDTETWQSIALIAGWSKWEVGIKPTYKKKKKVKEKKIKKLIF